MVIVSVNVRVRVSVRFMLKYHFATAQVSTVRVRIWSKARFRSSDPLLKRFVVCVFNKQRAIGDMNHMLDVSEWKSSVLGIHTCYICSIISMYIYNVYLCLHYFYFMVDNVANIATGVNMIL